MKTLPGKPIELRRTSKAAQVGYGALSKLPFLPSSRRYNITVCHEKRFVWFRVAKAGTRTIYDLLTKSNVSLDAKHPYDIFYPVRAYQNYFKFAFVRNPWDRLVSCWRNKVVDNNHFDFSTAELTKMREFSNFVDFVSGLNTESCDPHLRLQCRLIDLNQIDYLGRLESIDKDLIEVFGILDIPLMDIERRNVSSDRNPYWYYYDNKLVEKVYQIYCRDIQIFGYDCQR
jgi:hypothetical protein